MIPETQSNTMVREFSAGGVVLRKIKDRWHIAVIEPETRNESGAEAEKLILALPKGAVDEGESAEQAARREILEETGLRVSKVAKLTDTKYFYVRSWGDRAKVFKVVSFYLFIYQSGKLGNITEEMKVEVRRCLWVPLEEAPRKLSYKGERQVSKLAQQYVAQNGMEPVASARKVTRHKSL